MRDKKKKKKRMKTGEYKSLFVRATIKNYLSIKKLASLRGVSMNVLINDMIAAITK